MLIWIFCLDANIESKWMALTGCIMSNSLIYILTEAPHFTTNLKAFRHTCTQNMNILYAGMYHITHCYIFSFSSYIMSFPNV